MSTETKPQFAIKGRPGVEGFPERLKCVRLMRRMTQEDLARKCEMQPAAVSHFETSRRTPNIRNLRSLCMALNTSADYLLDSHDA